ncbi:hypothetical protein QGN23_02765 [Chryseobacterium gotjawalense]|uniref:Uncharacterized protein n=1 Tax=Chryseobacterium gotjawalense TaxID=3042315 RepID=A0ABY8REF1_9FLAO|nr:hypothetical protein [Chryseobacterium sp. wdc7]WHF52206.1 hypothetical protein QGN23_02765 [Chryseobacterium sp. wdc7]
MKKIILGLFLTVGISGIASANEIDIAIKPDETMMSTQEIYSEIYDLQCSEIIDCWHGYTATIVDCAGERHNLNMGGYAGECGGNENNSIVIHHMGIYEVMDCVGN